MRDLRHMQAKAAPDLEAWLDYLDLDGKAPKTIYSYSRTVAPLLRSHPDLAFDEFTHVEISAELALVPPRSRYVIRSIYNQWFQWGVGSDRLVRNPMLGKVPKMREPKRRPKDIFTDAEVASLEALEAPDGQLWTILFRSGIRRSEAIHLRREHIDLGQARLHVVDGKGGKDRVIAVPPKLVAAVADLDLLEWLAPKDHLWYRIRYPVGDHRRRTDPIGGTTFEQWYTRGIEAAGVRYLNPHQTRHTYGWWLRAQGWDIEERQFQMGHESIRTTQKYYGRMDISDLDGKAARL